VYPFLINRGLSADLAPVRNSIDVARFPTRWIHLIEKESLKFKELEHVLIEKADQLFRNML
jgi:hypothetical protein